MRDIIRRQQDRESERLKFGAILKDKDLEKIKIEAEQEIALKKLELESLSLLGGPKSTMSNARFSKVTIF